MESLNRFINFLKGNHLWVRVYKPEEVTTPIAQAIKESNDKTVKTLTDVFKNVQSIKGDTGPKGENGEKGDKGDPGKDGVDGKHGRDGKDGVNGKDGRDGKDGKPGRDGYTPVKGLDYFDGLDGKDGKDGKDGRPADEKALARSVVKAVKANLPDLSERQFVLFQRQPKIAVNELEDTSISNPTNNQVLKYNSATGKWVNGTGGGGTGVVETIVAGTNITVDATDPANPIVSSDILADGGVFLSNIEVPDDAYDATTWNGNFEVPTKNAIRDKIETISGGGISDGDKGDITVSGSGSTWTIDNGMDATKIADGSVSNTEFQYINSLTSNAQTQLDTKTTKAFAIAMACAL